MILLGLDFNLYEYLQLLNFVLTIGLQFSGVLYNKKKRSTSFLLRMKTIKHSFIR